MQKRGLWKKQILRDEIIFKFETGFLVIVSNQHRLKGAGCTTRYRCYKGSKGLETIATNNKQMDLTDFAGLAKVKTSSKFFVPIGHRTSLWSLN